MGFIKKYWPVFVLVAVGLAVYVFNLNNPLFWDDDDWIINNTFVHNISWDNIKFWFTHNTLAGVGLNSNYYRPFLFLTFAVNYMISGVQPLLWHLTSNVIHIVNSLLVFSILYLVLRKRIVAFLTALIFLIHPLQTEAVTYIAGRGDSLVVLFMLIAAFLFLKSKDNPSRSLIYKSASLVSMAAGILSRETGIIFPFLLVIFYVAFLASDKFWISIKKAIKETWLYFGVVVIYGILRLTVLNFQNTLNFYIAPNPYSETLLYRMLTFMHVLVDYFRLLFVPTGLHMERSMTVHTSLFQWPVWLGAITVSCIMYLVFRFYRKERIQNTRYEILSTNYRVWLFGWGWFFIGLAPVSGITPINAVIYEHWLYLPMIGFWFVAAFYLVKVFNYLKSRNKLLYVTCFMLLVIYFAFFSYQSIKRNILWGKPIEFFEDILKYEPQSARSNNNLGNLYFNKGDTEKAVEYYQRSAGADDVFAQPHYNIGSILQSKGDIFGAIKEYEKSIEIDPGFHYSYQNLVVIYANQGNLIKATEYAEILKQLRPDDPRVYYNAALIYLARNNRDSAIENLNLGLKVIGRDLEAEQLIQDLLNRLK